MRSGRTPAPQELQREASIRFAIKADAFMTAAILLVGLASGSLTVIAECTRAFLMTCTELFSLLTMRRIHRGQLVELEYGPGKLEQVVNLGIALAMLLSSAWVVRNAFLMIVGERAHGTPAGLAIGASVMTVNTFLNFAAWLNLLHARGSADSLLMDAQVRTRFVKLVSSLIVTLLMTLAVVFTDPVVETWCDVLGALFVAGFMVVNACGMIRTGLPDLLDKSINDAVQAGLNRALARHFEDYSRLGRVRTRLSGQQVFIEVALGFDGGLAMAEVDRRIRAIKTSIAREVAQAEVAILASVPAGGQPARAGPAKA